MSRRASSPGYSTAAVTNRSGSVRRAPTSSGGRDLSPITLNLPSKPVVYPERVRGGTVPGRLDTARPSKPILPETGRIPGAVAGVRPPYRGGYAGSYYPSYAYGYNPYSSGYSSYYGDGYDPYYSGYSSYYDGYADPYYSNVASSSYGGYRVSSGPFSSYAAGYHFPYYTGAYTPASGYTYASPYYYSAPATGTAVGGVDVRRSGYAPVSAGTTAAPVQTQPAYDASAAAYEAGYQRSRMEATYPRAAQPERPETSRRGQTLEK